MIHCLNVGGRIHGKGMNVARQILRRFGRATGARTRSAAPDCIVRTVSFGSDHLKTSKEPHTFEHDKNLWCVV